MSATKKPRVVAELGRPETPQETADRRAEASRSRRQNNSLFNLVIALLASLAVVAVIMLVVVRPDISSNTAVDYQGVAAKASAPVTLAAPDLPNDWWSNSAIYDGTPTDDVANWYAGFVTPGEQFIAFNQGIDANPTWLANKLEGMTSSGSTTIDGVEWTVYDRRGAEDVGNHAYALSTVGAHSYYVLHGTASDDEFTVLAKALAPTITADR